MEKVLGLREVEVEQLHHRATVQLVDAEEERVAAVQWRVASLDGQARHGGYVHGRPQARLLRDEILGIVISSKWKECSSAIHRAHSDSVMSLLKPQITPNICMASRPKFK